MIFFQLGIVILGLYNITVSNSIQKSLISLRNRKTDFSKNWNKHIDNELETRCKNIPKIMRDTLKKMLSYNRRERPTAKELYENREIFDCDNIIEDVFNQDIVDFAYI